MHVRNSEADDINPALLDQQLAMQWVQDNIRVFGGDKQRVSVLYLFYLSGFLCLECKHNIRHFGVKA